MYFEGVAASSGVTMRASINMLMNRIGSLREIDFLANMETSQNDFLPNPSATTHPAPMPIVRGNNLCTSFMSYVETNMVIGSSRSKLINFLRARGPSPAEVSPKTKMLGFMESTMHLAETTSATSTQLVTLDGFK